MTAKIVFCIPEDNQANATELSCSASSKRINQYCECQTRVALKSSAFCTACIDTLNRLLTTSTISSYASTHGHHAGPSLVSTVDMKGTFVAAWTYVSELQLLSANMLRETMHGNNMSLLLHSITRDS